MAYEQDSMTDPFEDHEQDFFSARDPQSRADAYADFDPELQPARAERRIFAYIGVGIIALLAVIYALMPDVPTENAGPAKPKVAQTTDKASPTSSPAAAKIAPVSAAKAAPASARPSRLARLLEKNASPQAGAAPSPPVAASATPLPATRLHASARAQIVDGEFDRALETLTDSAKGFDTHALRGWALYELGRDADARRNLEAALAVRPDHAESLLLLGSLQQTRDDDAAKETYRAFLAAHPNAPQASEVRQILDRI